MGGADDDGDGHPAAGGVSFTRVYVEANESGLGALRRYLGDQAVALRSDGADVAQDHTRVELLPVGGAAPSVSSYTYVSPNGLAEGYGLHEIADWALTHDGRDTRLFVAMGLRAGASASTGEAWAIAAARAKDGTRPVPYVYVDRIDGVG